MTTKSIRTSPAVLEMTATKVEKFGKTERHTLILHEREELGMCADSAGKCTVSNHIKIANCFGQYTSLQTGISLEFPCDPETFEDESARYHARVSRAIMTFQNKTLEAVGQDKMWHGTQPTVTSDTPKSTKPGKKSAGRRPAVRVGSAPKRESSDSKPVAVKRVPRKR